MRTTPLLSAPLLSAELFGYGQLVISPSTGLFWLDGQEQMVMLSPGEVRVLYTLVESYPGTCSREKLLASYHGCALPVSQQSIDEWRQRMASAHQQHAEKKLLKPLYNTVGKLRGMLQGMGIDIDARLRDGYRLVLYEQWEERDTLNVWQNLYGEGSVA